MDAIINSPLGNGLIEISGIATLFGTSTAASFALGNKAAAGLPWACISTFGAIQVAQASLSAAIPDWLRDPFGLNSEDIDAAVGKLEKINKGTTAPDNAAEISAIRTLSFSPFLWRNATDERFKGDILPSGKYLGEGSGGIPMVVYSLDAACRGFARAIPISDHKTLRIHQIRPKAIGSSVESPTPKKDWIILLASLFKLIEAGVLWYLGAERLWWTSSVAWLASFCGALVLQICHLSRDDFAVARSNILIGQIPTPVKLGGKANVILGTSGNVRRHWAWRVVWFANMVAVLFSLFTSFFALPDVPPETVYVWLAFQSLFMLTRLLVHHFTLSISSTSFLLRSASWEESSVLAKRRSLQLLMSLALYHATRHPRGPSAYGQSLTSFEGISLKLSSCSWRLTETLYLPQRHSFPGAKETIVFIDVIPDTVLSTISWALNKQYVELYDSAIVFISNMAIPCVRVYSCTCEGIPDDGTIRGMAHNCQALGWIFWIPYRAKQGEEGYLSVSTENTHEAVNEFQRIDHQTLHTIVSKQIGVNVSIRHGDEVKMILERTREVARGMVEMFKEAQGVNKY